MSVEAYCNDTSVEVSDLENRITFLENSFLLVLMNPNLYEMLQSVLLQNIGLCKIKSKTKIGEELHNSIMLDDRKKEELTGPEEIDYIVLESTIQALQKKMENYRKTGNLNL